MNNHLIWAMMWGSQIGVVGPLLLRRVVDLVDKRMEDRRFPYGIR